MGIRSQPVRRARWLVRGLHEPHDAVLDGASVRYRTALQVGRLEILQEAYRRGLLLERTHAEGASDVQELPQKCRKTMRHALSLRFRGFLNAAFWTGPPFAPAEWVLQVFASCPR